MEQNTDKIRDQELYVYLLLHPNMFFSLIIKWRIKIV